MQLPINLEIEISLCNKKSYSQFPDLYEPVQAANVNTANNAKINFFIVSPFSCPPKRFAKEDVFLTQVHYESILTTLQVFYSPLGASSPLARGVPPFAKAMGGKQVEDREVSQFPSTGGEGPQGGEGVLLKTNVIPSEVKRSVRQQVDFGSINAPKSLRLPRRHLCRVNPFA